MMLNTLAEMSIIIPDATSPWFFWYVTFGIAIVGVLACCLSSVKAGKLLDQHKANDGYVTIAIVTGLIGVVSLIYSASIFHSIFSLVLAASQ